MASKDLMEFEKAMKYMDPMEVNDYLQKTLDFLKRNNSEVYFPSISPYVEGFLVNLVTDTRNLKSKAFKDQDRVLAEEIIEILEMSREVFRWTHAYENGKLLVYKKIFSNKIKKKPVKLSTIADRLIQARASALRRPHAANLRAPLPHQEPATMQPHSPHTEEPIGTFKVRFLNKTLRFIKSTQTKLSYEEMHLRQAEYIYNLLKYREKDVGFGFKSLYAPLWEAMEECKDCKFEVTFKETSRKETAALLLEKVPKNSNKSKKDKEKPNNIVSEKKNKDETHKDKNVSNSLHKENKDSNIQTGQSLDKKSSALPPLELLTNISEPFFKRTIIALTEFADDASFASRTFSNLQEEEILFVKNVRQLAGTAKFRELFDPHYRDLLWRLNSSINEAAKICKITTNVNDKERSITLKKAPKFATPAPVPPKVQPNVATGARSKSMAPMRTRDRSLSKDRLIQFEKGGKPSTDIIDLTKDEEPQKKQERGRSMSRRTAKLLEDLSTPVESDIGMRMMLMMGWQGGALGARGDGIMEPLMPNIDQPKRVGLGHVPPPKVIPRKPMDFRLMLLHNLLDCLLEDEWKKEILLEEPLVEKERKFLHYLLTSVNCRHNIQLTGKENKLLSKIYNRLADYPSMELRGDISKDLKTVTLQKLLDRPLRALNIKIPKPKNQPQNQSQPQQAPNTSKNQLQNQPQPQRAPNTFKNQPQNQPQPQRAPSTSKKISKADVDVVISRADVANIYPHINITQLEGPVTPKAVRKRALRLLFLTKLAEALSWDWWDQATFMYEEGGIPEHIIILMRTAVVHLNNGDRRLYLYGAEAPVFEAMLGSLLEANRATLAVDFKTPTYEEGGIPEHIIILMRTAVVHLNNGDRCLYLYGAEAPVFTAMLEALLEAKGATLAVEFKQTSKFILTRTRTVEEKSLPNNFAKLKVSDKNNDSNVKLNKSNQHVNMNDNNKKALHEKDTSKELNTTYVIENVDNSTFNENVRDDLKDTASAKIDVNIEDNVINVKFPKSDGLDESNILIEAIENVRKVKIERDVDMDVNNNKDDCLTQKPYENDVGRTILGTNNVENKIVDDHKSNKTIENRNLKDIKVECDNNLIKSTDTKVEGLEIKIQTNDNIEHNKDKENDILMNIEEIKKEKTDFGADNLKEGLSDLDKDIRDLEMTILNAEADFACHVKTENDFNDCASDLEIAISDTDLSFIIKQENEDSNISGKRCHSNSICSQEVDAKKYKIITESDENVVIIKPNNPDEIMTEDIIKEVQTAMAKELDKAGGFLPLLKCHGTQNGGLVYSCHDDDDVAWIKKVISDAKLDLEIVPNKDLCLRKKRRELLIKINSYIPLDTKKIFRKFEMYNVGLDTKFWMVSFKQATSTFVMLIVNVDEKSFKYISDENLSLYCGIDTAQFSVI